VNERRDTARRWVIDERLSNQEIGHLIVVSYDEGPARIEMEGYVNEARVELRSRTDLEPNRRPRLIPDAEEAVRDAVASLRITRTRLTWVNVATWMRDNVAECDSLSEKTLRGWRDEDHWPSLSDPWWRAD
jgi:hypothetical protein